MSNQLKSALWRLLKGAGAAALSAGVSYLSAHWSDVMSGVLHDPTKQAALVSLLTGLFLGLEKFLGWKEKI